MVGSRLQSPKVREVHSRTFILVQSREVKVQIHRDQGRFLRDYLQESRVRQAKPSKRLVTRGVYASDDDFLTLVNDETELVEEAGPLRLPMLTEQIRRLSKGVWHYEHPVNRIEKIDQDVEVFGRVCSQTMMLCD